MQFKVETFLTGLKEDLWNEVTLFKPRLVLEAKNLALMQESKLADVCRLNHCSAYPAMLSIATWHPLPPRVKQITLDEQKCQREAGLCVKCDERPICGCILHGAK